METLLKISPYLYKYNEYLEKNDIEEISKYEKLMCDIIDTDNGYSPKIVTYDPTLCKCGGTFYEYKEGNSCDKCGICTKESLFGLITPKEIERTGYNITKKISYDKINHLNNILKRFQSQDSTVPKKVIDDVILEIKKNKIQDISTISIKDIKTFLKKLKYNKYYVNSIYILNTIKGTKSFCISQDLQNHIVKMFLQIEEPWQKYKDKDRKNHLSFFYILHKIFHMLNLPEYAEYFPLLKSTEKLRQHETIFKKIIEDLQKNDKTFEWTFKSSI
jgi:hypothetical protein